MNQFSVFNFRKSYQKSVTSDTRPGTHLIGGTWKPRPGALKLGPETLIIRDTLDAESGYSDDFLSFLRVWLERINSRASCV